MGSNKHNTACWVKYKDIMELFRKYVAQNEVWFYNGTQPDNVANKPDVAEGCDSWRMEFSIYKNKMYAVLQQFQFSLNKILW